MVNFKQLAGPLPIHIPVASFLNTPPGSPALGDRYLVDATPTGDFVGHVNEIAEWDGAAWDYTIPVPQSLLQVGTTRYRFTGSSWVADSIASGWVEYIFPYSAFSTAALTNSLAVTSVTGRVISQVEVKHSTAFVGTGVTAVSARIGIAGEQDRYSTDFDIVSAVAPDNFKRTILNLQEDAAIIITLESEGANLDQLSAGDVVVRLLLTDVDPGSPLNSEFSFGMVIGDGVNPIPTGEAGTALIPYNGTIIGWYVIGDVVGSIEIDVYKDSYANYPPTAGDTITGTEKPSLTSQNKNTNMTIASWAKIVLAGDVVTFSVDSVSGGLKRVQVLVLVSRG